MKRDFIIFLIVCVGCVGDARAEDNRFGTDLVVRAHKTWSAGTFSDFSVGSRFLDAGSNPDRLYIEASIARNLEHFRFSGGYYVQVYRPDQKSHEHRLWQQADYRVALAHSNLDFHERLEERYFGPSEKVSWRSRTAVIWHKAITTGAQLSFGDEIVTNLNSTSAGISRGFNQNRVLAGITCHYSKAGSIQFLYQFRYIDEPVKANYYLHLVEVILRRSF